MVEVGVVCSVVVTVVVEVVSVVVLDELVVSGSSSPHAARPAQTAISASAASAAGGRPAMLKARAGAGRSTGSR